MGGFLNTVEFIKILKESTTELSSPLMIMWLICAAVMLQIKITFLFIGWIKKVGKNPKNWDDQRK